MLSPSVYQESIVFQCTIRIAAEFKLTANLIKFSCKFQTPLEFTMWNGPGPGRGQRGGPPFR